MHTGVYGIKEIGTLLLLFDICVDKKRVCFRVNIFHHDLEAIKAASFWYLDLPAESFNQVLVDDAIGRGEECQHMRDEVSFIIIQSMIPIMQILGEIDFFGRPE